MYEEVDRQTIEAWMKEKTQQKKAIEAWEDMEDAEEEDDAQKKAIEAWEEDTGGIQGQSRHMHKEANEIMYIICTAVVVICCQTVCL